MVGNSEIEMFLGSIQKQTNLSDWGDQQFLVPLRKLVEAFEESYQLQSAEGEVFLFEMRRLLTNRLVIQNELKRRPDILEIPIEQPLFILGLPRSGTTLLHHLLAQDPAARAPLFWEMLWPVPVGGLGNQGNRGHDPRIAWAEHMIKKIDNPKEIHELKATNPEECHVLLMNTFMCPTFYLRWNVPSYFEWLKQQDMTSAYGYYKVLLQILLRTKSGNHFVLKDPAHLDFLENIAEVFPNAKFIWLHRDPSKVVPSFFNLMQKCFRKDYTITDAIS
jgi:hypothetical protein